MKTLICDCNRTMSLDGPALARAIEQVPGTDSDGLETVHTLLCRREAPAFQRAAKAVGAGDELLVACTQEQRLFLELNEQTEGASSIHARPIRFLNIRETAGWSRSPATGEPAAAADVLPKMAALVAAAQRPDPDPVPVVTYRSQGRVLVIGPAESAEAAAQRLQDRSDLEVELLCTPQAGGRSVGGVPQQRNRLVHAGVPERITGWLGNFEVRWESSNPIDLDLCTRCNACLEVCPEGAIGLDYQIDLSRCSGHRACVRVCEAAGAIDFRRQPQAAEGRFDLVLDLRDAPAYAHHQWPQGYRHVAPAAGDGALWEAVAQLRELVGEFDKPRFFQYRPKLCAHSRNERTGCTACIDVCSAKAVRSDASLKGKASSVPKVRRPDQQHAVGGQGGGILVEPFLCVGCGACTTVCPTGAMTYAYPPAAEQGQRFKTLLSTYAAAGGKDAVLLLHSQERGQALVNELGRAAQLKVAHGVPANVIPVALWHTASTGVDLWLSAVAYGASQIVLLVTNEEAPQYLEGLQAQMDVAQRILNGLGYTGTHLRIIEAKHPTELDAALQTLGQTRQRTPSVTARFAIAQEKRSTLDMALDHLVEQSPLGAATLPAAIELPAKGSPLGTITVDKDRCTLCLSCVSACPASALQDNPQTPQLRFLEKNCVQCGLCQTTCPENAISLQPRLSLTPERAQLRVLNEAQPWACVRCSKPFGTVKAIEAMLGKLAGHAMFQGEALERLKMCSDCRVIDLYSAQNESKVTDL